MICLFAMRLDDDGASFYFFCCSNIYFVSRLKLIIKHLFKVPLMYVSNGWVFKYTTHTHDHILEIKIYSYDVIVNTFKMLHCCQ